MSFFSQIKELFESLFRGSGPEAKQKQELKKIEIELRNFQPAIYKSGMALPNFAEVFRILSIHTKPLKKLFSETIDNPDIKFKEKYYDILIQTGFSDKSKEILEKLKYENRKNEFYEDSNVKRVHESQRKNFDILLRELASGSFSSIERTLQNLEILVDFCNFSFDSIIKEFDADYTETNYKKENFNAIPLVSLELYLQDLYFFLANFKIDAALGRAVLALGIAKSSDSISEKEQNALLSHIRKISTVLTRILNPSNIKKILRLSKNDPLFEPKVSENSTNIIMAYADRIRNDFENDTQRIDVEVQDENIKKEISAIFENEELVEVAGYNQYNSNVFFRSGSGSFLWITPLEILKNFVSKFFTNKVDQLLNDIVVEGFFNNPQYKSDFSSIVFACCETANVIKEFEESFERNGKNNISLMTGYLHDSHSDPTFMRTLVQMITSVNLEAKNLVQKETTKFVQLKKRLEELIPDAKRTAPEHIENLRVLFTSTRNRDNSEFLETTFSKWNNFLDIMKNYVIIGDV